MFGERWFLNWERRAVLEGRGGTTQQIKVHVPGERTVFYEETSPTSSVFISQDGWNTEARIIGLTIERDLACGSKEIYHKNNGRLLAYYDKAGNQVQLGYNGEGRLSQITDVSLGRSVTINYGANTLISSIADWTGRTWSFEYNAGLQRLEAIVYPPTPEYPTGYRKRFYYNHPSDSFLVTGIGWNDEPAYQTISYGANRHVTNQTFAAGNPRQFSYDFSNGRTITVANPDGSKQIRVYNTLDHLTEYKEIRRSSVGGGCPESAWGEVTNVWNYVPNERGQATNATSSAGLSVQRQFSGFGYLLSHSETDTGTSLSKSWTYTYDTTSCGKSVRTAQDPAGNVTTTYYEFDEATLGDLNGDGVTSGTRALPVKVTLPAVTNALTGALENPVTLIRYDQMGRATWMRDASHRTNSFGYTTGKSRPTSVTMSGGASSLTYALGYDSLDRLTSIITPAGLTNTLAYNARDLLVTNSSSLASLPLVSLGYDVWGNVTSTQLDPGSAGGVGGTISAVYNALGWLTAVTNQLGHATTVQYNNQRLVWKITCPLGREDEFEYRADGMLKKALDALDQPTDFCYDQFGRLKQVRDARGNSYQFLYDAWSRLTRQTFADGSYEQYGYEGNDQLISWRNRAGQITTYQYDGLGRLVREARPEGTWTYKYLLTGELAEVRFNGQVKSSYTYDALGRLVSQTEYGRTIDYAYDAQGRRSSITYPDGWAIAELRDAANRFVAISSAGQTNFSRSFDGMGRVKEDRWFGGAVTKTYLYDAAGQLTNWVVSATGGWTQSRDLRYDAGSRIVTQAVNGAVRAYGYDLTDQLLSATGTQSYSASYDALGNRLTADDWGYTANNINGYTERAGTPTAGLVGWWKLDEGSGGVANDSSGQGNTSTLYNGPAWTSGVFSNALDFDGVDDYVGTGSGNHVGNYSSFTVAGWVNIRQFSNINPKHVRLAAKEFVLFFGFVSPNHRQVALDVGGGWS